jgi:hypothetical protein
LVVQDYYNVPDLPPRHIVQEYRSKGKLVKRKVKRVWHPFAIQGWIERWQSPISEEWIEADYSVVRRVLAAETLYWEGFESPETPNLSPIMAQILQCDKLLGITPMARRSLQWTISDDQVRNVSKAQPIPVDATSVDMPDPQQLAESLQ